MLKNQLLNTPGSEETLYQGPNTFSTVMAVGNQFLHKGLYLKAVESYTAALAQKPKDKTCLVSRSKCFLRMGDCDNALRDAEAALKQDKKFVKGLYQKAEALYTKGDFEFALVFYHRGHKLRPELQEFRLGIQKAEEAIENSVGMKLESKGQLLFASKGEDTKMLQPVSLLRRKREMKQKKSTKSKNERTAKQLLGELHSDKEYLDKLLKDEGLTTGKMQCGERVHDVLLDCVNYLHTRSEFWRQQKLIYTRERTRKLMQKKWNKSSHRPISDPARFVLKSLREIDRALISGDAKGSLEDAQDVMKTVEGWTEEMLPNKNEVMANLHCAMGNALMELGEMCEALSHYEKDLELAIQGDLLDVKSNALDNIGRVHVQSGRLAEAIEVWKQKIPFIHDSLEKTLLFFEIGRCYLELHFYTEAAEYARESLEAADEIEDEKWQLNANLLVAQSEFHLGDIRSCVIHYERALDRARVLGDVCATDTIEKALNMARQNSVQ